MERIVFVMHSRYNFSTCGNDLRSTKYTLQHRGSFNDWYPTQQLVQHNEGERTLIPYLTLRHLSLFGS